MYDRLTLEGEGADKRAMAQALKLRVQCHACGYLIEGTAKYGQGHYVPEGIPFDFTATGKVIDPKGKRIVRGEVTVICPKCTVRNKHQI